jgi:hypothetical protein
VEEVSRKHVCLHDSGNRQRAYAVDDGSGDFSDSDDSRSMYHT